MTEEMTIEQQNEMIARFMEVERDVNTWRHPYGATVYLIGGYWFPAKKLKYHSSWEWLMPVVEKIRSLGCRVEIIIGVACDVFIHKIGGNPEKDKLNIIAYSKPQEAVYTAVAQFVKWHTTYISSLEPK